MEYTTTVLPILTGLAAHGAFRWLGGFENETADIIREMEIPEQLRPYFPSYELSDLDRQENSRLIITNLLNFGDTQAVAWLLSAYQLSEIVEVIQNPSRGTWTSKALNYWQIIFDVEVEQGKATRAIMDVTPRPDVYSSILE
jgi:hypothetical protein